MKSNEEFIEGIYRKAEMKKEEQETAFRKHRGTVQKIWDYLSAGRVASLQVSAAFVMSGIVLVFGLGLLWLGVFGTQSEQKGSSTEAAQGQREPGSLDMALNQKESGDTKGNNPKEIEQKTPDEEGIALAEENQANQDLALAQSDTEPTIRMAASQEYQIKARLLRMEELGESVVLYYEALEVEDIEVESSDGRPDVLPEEGKEFSLILSEEELAWFYPEGVIPESCQQLWVYPEEESLVLSYLQEERESER